MTENQKKQIARMRANGTGYGKIAQEMGISLNTIKSYCRRNKLNGNAAEETPAAVLSGVETKCENCGKVIRQIAKQKKKRFCCDKCRNEWWNSHLDLVKRKAVYKYVCPHCKKEFEVYGNSHRKYCCHECYIADRFGGGGND